jgi:hypothetical protein
MTKPTTFIWASRFAAYGGSRRAIRSITFAPCASLCSHFVASVVPLLCASRKAEPFLSQKTLLKNYGFLRVKISSTKP